MNENYFNKYEKEPHQEIENDTEKEQQEEKVAKILRLVEEINESGEILSFPGVNQESYSKMKNADDKYPGYVTPIDEVIERCEKEGIKVVMGDNPESGNIYVLPADSNDIEMDGIVPRQLEISVVENKNLAELIKLTTKN